MRPTHRSTPTRRTARSRRQRGSAYIFALLILILLTLIGLSLALISSTEMQVGANERLIQRTFYTADAALGLSSARILVSQQYNEGIYQLNSYRMRTADDGAGPTETVLEDAPVLVSNRVSLSPQIPLFESPCGLCQINEPSTGYSPLYRRINVAVTATAERATPDGSTVVASNTIGANLDIQPIERPKPGAFTALARYSEEELADKVKF